MLLAPDEKILAPGGDTGGVLTGFAAKERATVIAFPADAGTPSLLPSGAEAVLAGSCRMVAGVWDRKPIKASGYKDVPAGTALLEMSLGGNGRLSLSPEGR